jgi:uncharacterized protein YjiS (DUF1127 family)
MRFENQFPTGRSSGLLGLRRGDPVISDAGRMLGGPAVALRPRDYRRIHRSVVQDSPERDDGESPTSSDTTWRVISAAVSGLIVSAGGGLAACGELAVSRLLIALVSWIFVQFMEGCAAYAAGMYPVPMDLDEPMGRCAPPDVSQPGREDPNRLGSPKSGPGEIFPSTKGAIRGNATVLYLALPSAAALETEFVASPQAPRAASTGWTTSIKSVAAGIRARIRWWRDRRLAMAELRSLDDRGLRDVGISRCDIEYIVRHGDRRE